MTHIFARRRRVAVLAAGACLAVTASALTAASGSASTSPTAATAATDTTSGTAADRAADLVPKPMAHRVLAGQRFELDRDSHVVLRQPSRADRAVATGFAEQLRRATGFAVPVSSRPAGDSDIVLSSSAASAYGAEGYRLRATDDGLRISARGAEGLFRGLTTLRHLLPAKVESMHARPGPWRVAGADITDQPRFGYRGVMLDVSRHFFTVEQVKRYIDLASLYKVNTLHLHLSDDQGWRIQVDSWPRLTRYGGSTEVGGGPGGYYTKAEFAELVSYAAQHYIDVVPEIDTPGHTNAALASYARLNCDGEAPPLYTGIEVGFSSLCIDKEITYDFLDDVFGEVAAQAPGKLLHLGGDEAHSTPHEDYLDFVPRASALVRKHDKRVMGWQEIAETPLPPKSLVQYWGTDDARSQQLARMGVAQDAKVVMSPANRVYLDMKYKPSTPYGLDWAGYVPPRKSYSWDPATLIPGVPERAVAGVEAPMWSETLDEFDKAEFMAFPRLPGVAEIGWSPAGRSWDEYKYRLAGQAARWQVLDVDYFEADQVPWD